MRAPAETILILGGTSEAAEIATALVARGARRVISSLAGRTRRPAPLPGETRIGGFGGVAGFVAYIRSEHVDTLVDATHPFAAAISANASKASHLAGVRLLALDRPAWQKRHDDAWSIVASLEEAAAVIPPGATVLLALGSQHLDAFNGRKDADFLVRMVDPPDGPLNLARYRIILGRPSPDAAREADLLRDNAVTHIVCRNSGGVGAYAKIEAARRLRLPVIMVDRPAAPTGGQRFDTVDALLTAL
ncbi:cobalt-precorrin-6A reductase [Pararhizobium haloflavum]|uniref:cobalt-precorrin-6A reductase n=1 Tax=Pararhizobium haloflavum TaxID=2037914 RepID=UPI000C1A4B97|nr:cobalt-precorrin-6A reductase [Pararhizobium haloflavum]